MDTSLKVLHIIKSLGRGGAEVLLPETLKLHNQRDFEFHYIYFLPWKDQMVEVLQRHGGRVLCIKANNNLELISKVFAVAAYVRRNNISIIHAHLPWAGIVARFVGKITGIPVIYTEHNKQERYHWATRRVNLLTMNLCSRVVAVSNDVAVSIKKHKPELKTRLQTVLNGVNTDYFRPGLFDGAKIKKQLGIPLDAPVVGTVAVFRFQKRLDVWLDVASGISSRLPSCHFIIVGDGPLRSELHSKSEQLGLLSKVHFVGLQTAIREYLAAFDVYMMSSIFEGLPIALLEAMSAGCPVVSTDAGGVKEVIRHEIDGMLCDIETPEKLEGLVVGLLKSPEIRKVLSSNGRSRIEQLFSMQKMVSDLEGLYREFQTDTSN